MNKRNNKRYIINNKPQKNQRQQSVPLNLKNFRNTAGFGAIKNAFCYSMSGMCYLLKERAFRDELKLGLLLFIGEFFRNTSHEMRLYLLTAYILVLITEALNTAVEAAIDRIGSEKHELSKQAKDIGSAAVFLALVHLGIVWLLCF